MIQTMHLNDRPNAEDDFDCDEDTRVSVIAPMREVIRAYRAETIRHGILADTIAACIAEGATTRNDIIRTVLKVSSFRPPFTAVILDRCTGTDPRRSVWELSENGEYRLLRS